MKRVAAIVLPELACELARHDHLVDDDSPFGVIVDDEAEHLDPDEPIDRRATLDAVDRRAWKYGARPGQTAAQAAAFVGKLQILRLSPARVRQALGHVAEMALGFGTTAAIELKQDGGRLIETSGRIRYPLGAAAGPYDTVWLDVSGCARLTGGEDVLCADLRERARALGHRARVAIADGPRIAQAVARWSLPVSKRSPGEEELVVSAGRGADHLRPLPVAALPIGDALTQWLLKLGILRIDDLARLDRARLAHRLGPQARDLLDLIAGRDGAPLLAYQAPRRIVEAAAFDHALDGSEPLLFVLRGLVSRAVSRLSARGQASGRAAVTLGFDRGILALHHRHESLEEDTLRAMGAQRLDIELPMPLSTASDLLRAVHARLERLELPAPVVSVELALDGLTTKAQQQLDLHRKHRADPDALPTLLAELGAWVGTSRVGVMSLVDSHRPEARSRLVPVDPTQLKRRRPDDENAKGTSAATREKAPTRILPCPLHVGRLAPGQLVNADRAMFTIAELEHTCRLDRVEWWSSRPVCRDYARSHLAQGDEHAEAWVYLDRLTGQGYLQGWFE